MTPYCTNWTLHPSGWPLPTSCPLLPLTPPSSPLIPPPQLAFSPVVAAVEFAGAAGESEEGPLLSPALHSFSLLGKKLAGMYAGGRG